jgi:cysteine desulfurase
LPSVYLDHNATSPVRPEVIAAMADAMAAPGNASSVHAFGRAARNRLEAARATIAGAVGAVPANVVLTSGGTEANSLALLGLPGPVPVGPVLVSAVEHPSVLEAVPDAIRIPVDNDGLLRLDALEALLATHRPRLVSVMLANNETGVVQPVAEAAALAHAAGALLHADAVQALGKLPLDLGALGADLLTLSAHKLGGPPGVGALVLARELELTARQRGGSQERRRRAGTENLPAIAGFARAIELIGPGLGPTLRDALEARLLAGCPDVLILGRGVPRLPNTTCILMPGVEASTQLMALDLDGIAASSGAACSSGKVGPSHVLQAMAVPEALARTALRVSLGWPTTAADIDRFATAWLALHRRHHRVR